MNKKIIDHIITGVGLAFVITNIMMFTFARQYSGTEVVSSYILWMIAGIFYGAASLIYDSKLKKSLVAPIHFLMNMAISFITIKIMFDQIFRISIDFSYFYLFLIFTATYCLISLFIFLYEKVCIKALNEKLSKRNN